LLVRQAHEPTLFIYRKGAKKILCFRRVGTAHHYHVPGIALVGGAHPTETVLRNEFVVQLRENDFFIIRCFKTYAVIYGQLAQHCGLPDNADNQTIQSLPQSKSHPAQLILLTRGNGPIPRAQ